VARFNLALQALRKIAEGVENPAQYAQEALVKIEAENQRRRANKPLED
jgi:hypothetical protein